MRSRIKHIAFYALILLAIGCGTKKKSTSVKVERSDTLVVRTETIKAPLITETFTLKELCKDSVLTEFEKVFIRHTDTITIQTVDGSLNVRISQQERILSEKESTIQQQSEKIASLEQIVKTRSNPKLVLILFGAIALLVIFPEIPYRIKKFVLKLIRGF